MPRKRHIDKRRRMDPYEGAEAWADVFRSGFALFDDFTDETGVQLEPRTAPNGAPMRGMRPARSDSEAAWRTYGAAYIALNGRERHDGRPLWALEQFGEPVNAS